MYTVILFIAALAAGVIRILIKRPKGKAEFTSIFLLYMIFFSIGLGGLYAFMGHAFLADEVAREIGWPTGSPFQFEVAIANLAFGILGVLCVKIRGNFLGCCGYRILHFSMGCCIRALCTNAKGRYFTI